MITGPAMPTAGICINKSRLKVYNKESVPTYYLQKGQEFQIELYNPTSNTILAKIKLNNKAISQGGLVLRPGERVFLERYLDVAKKFLFDTYEVANTTEVQKAIEDNGDFKVEFFKESAPTYYTTGTLMIGGGYNGYGNGWGGTICPTIVPPYSTTTLAGGSAQCMDLNAGGTSLSTNMNNSYLSSNATLTNVVNTSSISSFNLPDTRFKPRAQSEKPDRQKKEFNPLRSNKIETGRVEAGSQSNQQIETVSKTFDYYPFHTIEYKMLPVSQKVNTIEDVNIKRYCHNCGTKQKPEFKFCPTCGAKC